jgi:hypothetical protein
MAKWMQKVASDIEQRGTKGSFKAAAARAGMSTAAYASKEEHAPGKMGRKARLALAFMRARRKKR